MNWCLRLACSSYQQELFKVTVPAQFRICLKQIIVDWRKKENRLTKAPETSKTFAL